MNDATVLALLGAISFLPPLAFMVLVRNRERHGREPFGPLVGIFVYGATMGVTGAIILGLFLDAWVGGALFLTAVVAAPLIEEFTKGLGLGLVRRHVDELEDGLVYGAAVGVGFAATETFLYGITQLVSDGAQAAFATVLLRMVSSMLLHASSSALVGFGYSAMRLRAGAWPQLVPYYLLAVLLHASYNALVLATPLFGALTDWLGIGLAIGLVATVVTVLVGRVRRLDAIPGAT